MKKYRSGNLSDVIGTAGSMLLFMLFAVCMLIIISTAASTYGRISRGFDSTFSTCASLRYVSNKLRSADSAEILADGSALAVKDGGVVCVIYCGEDGLYEKTEAAESDLSLSGGSLIFGGTALCVSEADGLYSLTVTRGGESSMVYLRKGGCSE